MLVSLSFALTNAYAQSDWDCDKTDTNWHCAEKGTAQTKNNGSQASYQEPAINNKAPADNEEANYSSIQTPTDNDEELDPLSRPSKFPADAYSIQLLASGSKDKIIGLMEQYRIPSLIIEYNTADQTLYLWVAGTYYSKDDARIELDQLPTLPPNITPWVRPTNTIVDMPVLVRARL